MKSMKKMMLLQTCIDHKVHLDMSSMTSG
jgi:hypothetical protein